MADTTSGADSGPRRAGARRRVLFIGEGSTLAHAARPLALAAALPPDRFQAVVALPERYHRWIPPGLERRTLDAQSPASFAARLRSGRPLFSAARLADYFEQDVRLIHEVRPDVVVGDFRLSLAASARATQTPYITISNAYWSPDRPLRPVRPALAALEHWPWPLAEAAFRLAAPMALVRAAAPVDRLLTEHGLEPIDKDVRRAFTDADLTLWADIPALYPDLEDTADRRFLGPVPWEPETPAPPWWSEVPRGRPVAYLTLGSSGEPGLAGRLAGWLRGLGFVVLAASAGRNDIATGEDGVFVAEYLPGLAAAARSDIVVCNGGAPTSAQALLAGRPVLGVCSNMDQFLNMRAVQQAGAGLALRADSVGPGAFQRALGRLADPRFERAAAVVSQSAHACDAAATLATAIEGF